MALVVPAARLGTVRLWMFNVEAAGNRGHGVLLNDEEDPRTFEDPITGDPIQPDPDGSAASVEVTVLGCRFVGNGFGLSTATGCGERGRRGQPEPDRALGTVARQRRRRHRGGRARRRRRHVDVFGAQLTGNGSLTAADYDDGFDIDEYNDGGIFGQVVFSYGQRQLEEGLDFNENNAGDLRVNLLLVEANGNREEAIDYEEDDDFAGGGDLVTTMTASAPTATGRRRRRRGEDPREGRRATAGDAQRHRDRSATLRRRQHPRGRRRRPVGVRVSQVTSREQRRRRHRASTKRE